MTFISATMHTKQFKFSLLIFICYVLAATVNYTNACSSRTIPKPRPSSTYITTSSSISGTPLPTRIGTNVNYAPTAAPASIAYRTTTTTTTTSTTTTTARPNITFPTYKCPSTYDAWYCLNKATCFSVKIGESVMYSCECAIGYTGARCEFKEIDGSYIPQRPILEKASIASGATCALLFMLFICFVLYMFFDQQPKTIDEKDDIVYSDKTPFASTYVDDDTNDAVGLRCRYCNDKRCCGDSIGLNDAKAMNYRIRQHIETIPMTLKRSAKW